ncbi:MAG: amino acid ABC transporter substrate-binding protein [Cyanobacteria bacterium P01_C01_bin.38]
MFKTITVAALSLLLTAALPSVASAETIMEKVKRTGVLTAGTSKDAFPFAYKNKEGQLIGYSVDMLKLIQQELEKELGKKVKLKLVALNTDERIPNILNKKVDIVCDASSFTWERNKNVDFSFSYGATGTNLLVKKTSNIDEPKSLIGKRIGVLPKTTNEQAIATAQPQAKLVYFKDREKAYAALQQGKIDGFASDGILLEAWLGTRPNLNTFKVVPDRPLSREGIACMVPENNSDFLDTVNYTFYGFMQGFVNNESKYVTIFDRWFGERGAIPLNRDLRELAVETMRIVIDSYQDIPRK